MSFVQGHFTRKHTTLAIVYQVTLLLFVQQVQFLFVSIVQIYQGRALAYSFAYITCFTRRHLSKTCHIHTERHYIDYSLSSNSSSKCPFSSMCLCFYELNILMKIVSLFLAIYLIFLGSFC